MNKRDLYLACYPGRKAINSNRHYYKRTISVIQLKATELKITHVGTELTDYGRTRIGICAFGANGCDGPEVARSEFNEPICRNCEQHLWETIINKTKKAIDNEFNKNGAK